MHLSVALWGHPRSLSTALERSFMERGDFKVFHESFAYVYFMNERQIPILADHPEVSGLVNNAGLYLGRPIWDYDDDTINRVIDVNVKGPMWLSSRVSQHLLPRKTRGAIVNLASVAGEGGSSDAVYGTAKAGVIGLTKSNAMNFAPGSTTTLRRKTSPPSAFTCAGRDPEPWPAPSSRPTTAATHTDAWSITEEVH